MQSRCLEVTLIHISLALLFSPPEKIETTAFSCSRIVPFLIISRLDQSESAVGDFVCRTEMRGGKPFPSLA